MNEVRPQQFSGQHTTPPPAPKPLIGGGPPKITAPPTLHPKQDDAEPINLIGGAEESAENKIRANATLHSVRKEQYARKTFANGTGACRIRSFHGRLSAQGLEYMDNQINEWLDHNPDVEVKFVTSTVGVFEGKMREPALILNLWY